MLLVLESGKSSQADLMIFLDKAATKYKLMSINELHEINGSQELLLIWGYLGCSALFLEDNTLRNKFRWLIFDRSPVGHYIGDKKSSLRVSNLNSTKPRLLDSSFIEKDFKKKVKDFAETKLLQVSTMEPNYNHINKNSLDPISAIVFYPSIPLCKASKINHKDILAKSLEEYLFRKLKHTLHLSSKKNLIIKLDENGNPVYSQKRIEYLLGNKCEQPDILNDFYDIVVSLTSSAPLDLWLKGAIVKSINLNPFNHLFKQNPQEICTSADRFTNELLSTSLSPKYLQEALDSLIEND